MDKLLQYLGQYNPVPQYAQIAVGGKWEEAIRIDFNSTTVPDLMTNDIDASVAGEVFYKLSDGRILFFGLRYSSALKLVTSPEQFLQKLTESLKLVPSVELPAVLSELGQRLNNDPNTYTASETSYAELGVVDFWKSLGSLVLRKQGEPALTAESLRAKLSQNKALQANDKNHAAMEFVFSDPEHWIGIQVSKFEDGQYITDVDSLTQLVNMV